MSAAVLAAAGLGFAYRPGEPVLSDLDVSFQVGEMAALSGASGRGKSTLLWLLGLLMTPVVGEVLLAGRPTSALSDRQRSWLRGTAIGFVFQDAQLDATRTVLDNVVEGSRYRDGNIASARLRGLDLLRRFDVGVRPDRRPGEISGGQAQRIALARALLARPQIILADEPTGNLDSATTTLVLDALRDHAAGGGLVVIATHDPAVLERCERRVAL